MNKRNFLKTCGGFVAGVAMNLGVLTSVIKPPGLTSVIKPPGLTIAKIKESMELIKREKELNEYIETHYEDVSVAKFIKNKSPIRYSLQNGEWKRIKT